MFARKVATRLKSECLSKFTNLLEHEVLPWLRTQEGFLDLLILVGRDGIEVTTISFWDHEGNAQAFNSTGYPAVLKTLAELLDGTPYVKTFDVVSSTFHTIVHGQPPATEDLVQDGPSPGRSSVV